MSKAIEVEGLAEFQRAVRRGVDQDLPRRLGEAHRDIGNLVISKLHPRPNPLAVGEGAGAAVRASASKRDVILRVGGAHRASGAHTRKQPWGRRLVGRIGIARPPRPFIRGTIDRHDQEIADAYFKAISAAMSNAFHKTT